MASNEVAIALDDLFYLIKCKNAIDKIEEFLKIGNDILDAEAKINLIRGRVENVKADY